MKPRCLIGGLLFMLLVAAVCSVGLRHKSTTSQLAPADFEAAKFRQPVGWAFGRMIGAPQPSYLTPQHPAPPHESVKHSPAR